MMHSYKMVAYGIVLATVLALFCSAEDCNVSVCDVRLELADELHRLWNYQTCEDVFKLNCMCNNTIDVLFSEIPPYIYTEPKTKKVIGLFPGKLHLHFCVNLLHLAI